ncbi:MAG: hypothetical protein JWR50_712 [Mucilaginibacter sp.]|nr:hypothetical protein [Mucilaginibacter sp.]
MTQIVRAQLIHLIIKNGLKDRLRLNKVIVYHSKR